MPHPNRRVFLRQASLLSCGTLATSALPLWSNEPDLAAVDQAVWQRASQSAKIAGYSISKVQRWLHEKALPIIDPQTGLYPADGKWNYRDTAADCYPFLCWAAWLTDKQAFMGPVLQVLRAETQLCNRYGRIPVPYDWKQQKQITTLGYPEVVFQASEYIKDGLIAVVEATGKGPWFHRMLGIEEDLWLRADVESPYGNIVSNNVEVNGEQLQALVRLFTMTGDQRFLKWAERLGDLYLFDPDYYPSRLRDHGCEIIGGLGLLLAIESVVDRKKFRQYAPQAKRIFDAVLARGTNEDGIMFNSLAQEAGSQQGGLSDGWGYNYVGFMCYDMATQSDTYRHQIETTLQNLSKPQYHNYPWEGTSIDGFADSIEGCIYLVNRLPVPEAIAWIDSEMAENVTYADEPLKTADLWGTMKLQANGVRTVILHSLMHTQGVVARPWQSGLELGATSTADGGLAIVARSNTDWRGQLTCDIPRHREFLGFTTDWPRMNTLPEWFTVERQQQYVVSEQSKSGSSTFTGNQLHNGIPLTLKAGEERRLLLTPRQKNA